MSQVKQRQGNRPKTKVQKSSGDGKKKEEKEEEEKVGTRIRLGLKPNRRIKKTNYFLGEKQTTFLCSRES